jgi:hypothetical protein
MNNQQVTLEVTPEQLERLEAHAHQRGYESVKTYLQALIEADVEAVDEGWWDTQFARSQAVLSRLAQEAIEEDEAGLTEDFDPDTYEIEDN